MGECPSHSGGSGKGAGGSRTLLTPRTFRRTSREEHRAGTPSHDAEAYEASSSGQIITSPNNGRPRACCTNLNECNAGGVPKNDRPVYQSSQQNRWAKLVLS